jgi:phospholipase/carboxylesterase
MDIFARDLPPDTLLFFPRGTVAAPHNGYGWIERPETISGTMEDFLKPAQDLLVEIDRRLNDMNLPKLPLIPVGFSQGAALAYALTCHYSERISRLAILAGYFPVESQHSQLPSIAHKPVYIAHGTQDEIIPISKARETAQALERAGAAVIYCESKSGHKLALRCFQDLKDFLVA